MVAVLLIGPGAAQAALVGIYGGWGAFTDGAGRCHAIARPIRADGRRSSSGAFAVLFMTGRVGGVVAIRPSAPTAPGRDASLTVGGRRFPMIIDRGAAHAVDRPGNRAILAALRMARGAVFGFAGAGGGAVVDSYPLDGAPSAIDAAALACVRGR